MVGAGSQQTSSVPLSTAPPGTAPAASVTGRPRLPRLALTLVALTITIAIALAEVDRLITQVLGARGESASATELMGPAGFGKRETWTVWLTSGETDAELIGRLLTTYQWLDVAFVALYLTLTLVLLSRLVGRGAPGEGGPGPGADPRWRTAPGWLPRWALWLLGVVLLAEVMEFVFAGLTIGWLTATHDLTGELPAPGFSATALSFATAGKWLGLLALVVAMLAWPATRAAMGRDLGDLVRALWHHRLSLFVVLVVAVVGLVPGPDISDQGPDIVRSWVPDLDVSHLVAAVVAFLVAFVALLDLGRQRLASDWRKYVDRKEPPDDDVFLWGSPPGWWLLGPAAALSGALVLALTGNGDLVDGLPLGIFVAIPTALWLVSWAIRHVDDAPAVGVRPPAADLDRARSTWLTGDVLAAAAVALAGPMLVRAFTAPVVLGPLTSGGADQRAWIQQVAWVVVGLVLAAATFPLAERVLRLLDEPPYAEEWWRPWRPPIVALTGDEGAQASSQAQQRVRSRLTVVALVTACVALLITMLLPVQVAGAVGVVALMVLALTSWAVIIGFMIVRLQQHKPLEIFRVAGMRAAPVMTLLVVLPMVASLSGGDPDLHVTRPSGGDAAAEPHREALEEGFATWLTTSTDCDRDVDGVDVPVRPLVLVAAAGGGIRAAAWTTYTMTTFADDPCAASAVFLSSGVSGGSVGLTASRTIADAPALVEHLAAPSALGSAVAGLVVGDLVGGATGVRLPSLSPAGDGRSWRWLDRAGLMEAAWLAELPDDAEPAYAQGLAALAEPWSAEPASPVGYLVLNSATATNGCRVLVSQLDLTDPGAPDGRRVGTEAAGTDPNCGAGSGLPAASTDLVGFYGRCLAELDWITAAMLSARFPTVTPAGRVPGPVPPTVTTAEDVALCRQLADMQLVDGGYAEGSGLGTLVDIAPHLMRVVRDHNRDVVDGELPGPIVVPIAAYVDNHAGGDVAAPPRQLAAELLVPLAGLSARGVQVAPGTWLQRLAASLGDPCGTTDGDRDACTVAARGVHRALDGTLAVVAPSTVPGVSAPLGWTLSQDSQRRLRDGVAAEANRLSGDPSTPSTYPSFGDLLAVLEVPAG